MNPMGGPQVDVHLEPNLVFYFIHPLVFFQRCHFLPEALVDKIEYLCFHSQTNNPVTWALYGCALHPRIKDWGASSNLLVIYRVR